MPVYRPRTRLVNFRLSEEEYQVLKETCALSGARSVSDYARSAVLTGAMPVAAPVNSCADRWERIEGVVKSLESKMNELLEKESIATHG